MVSIETKGPGYTTNIVMRGTISVFSSLVKLGATQPDERNTTFGPESQYSVLVETMCVNCRRWQVIASLESTAPRKKAIGGRVRHCTETSRIL